MLSTGGRTWLFYPVTVANRAALVALHELCKNVPMRCKLGNKPRWAAYLQWNGIIGESTFEDYLGFRTEEDFFKFKICCMITGVTLGLDFKVVNGDFV